MAPRATQRKPVKIGNHPGVEAGLQGTVVPLARLSWAGAKTSVQHPLIIVAGALTAGDVLILGEQGTQISLGALAASPLVWAAVHRDSFKAVCWPALTGSMRHVFVYRMLWRKTMVRCGLVKDEEIAKLKRFVSGEHTDRLLVKLAKGQSTEEFEKAASKLAHGFGAKSCRVYEDKPGRLWLHFGTGEALQETIPALPIPTDPDLERVTIGRQEDGQPWRVWLHGAHLLIVGATYAGKGSVIWSLIRGIILAIQDRRVDMRVADGKGGMELRSLKDLCTAYEDDTVEAMAELIHQTRLDMDARTKVLAERGIRKHEPSTEFPLVVLLIDEVADITQYQDKKIRDQANSDITQILRKGRACGFSVIVALQDGRIEAIPFRRLFPTTVLLRVKSADEVDRVMGQGARERGAKCDQLRFKTDAGKGHIQLEGRRETMLVRAAFPTDEDNAAMIAEYGPSSVDLDRLALEQEFADDGLDERPASKP